MQVDFPTIKERDRASSSRCPERVAIIMDGNGRWAVQRGLPRAMGHQQGAQTVREITEYCRENGVKVLTLYAFSQQNWSRPFQEIEALMGLLRSYLKEEVPNMVKNGIRLGTIGELELLPAEVRDELARTMAATRSCDDMDLVLGLSYGGREEIVRAAARLAESGLAPEEWSTENFATHLDTAPYGDPDLLIRTGGEQRISNFLLWQSSYTELFFSPKYWPEFGAEDLEEIFKQYGKRQRRFGSTPEQISTR